MRCVGKYICLTALSPFQYKAGAKTSFKNIHSIYLPLEHFPMILNCSSDTLKLTYKLWSQHLSNCLLCSFPGTSVSVSTFNLVAISLERYGAICRPLQSRVWQTKSHALKVIAATWCLSFIIMTPYPIYSNLVPFTKHNNQTANMCRFLLPSDAMQQSW